jgi:hypothetical protein
MDHPTNMDKEYLEKNQKETYGNENKRNNWESLGINQVTGDQINSSKEKMNKEKDYNMESAELGEFETNNEYDQMGNERKRQGNESISEERAKADSYSDTENITYR